jgi:uncharacterized C2H2 Zn-finger protein
MKRHLEGRHSRTSGYGCPVCGMQSKTATKRQIHVRNAHGLVMSSVEITEMVKNKEKKF